MYNLLLGQKKPEAAELRKLYRFSSQKIYMRNFRRYTDFNIKKFNIF